MNMEWVNIKDQLPPVNELVLVLWKNSHDEIVHSVTSRSRISRYCRKDAPIDNRYWIYASRHEIKPLYWMPLPKIPQSEQCIHQNEVQRQGDGFVYTVCGDCGKDLE